MLTSNELVKISAYNYNGELVKVLFIERTKKFNINDLNPELSKLNRAIVLYQNLSNKAAPMPSVLLLARVYISNPINSALLKGYTEPPIGTKEE